jgi:hypothetical protein
MHNRILKYELSLASKQNLLFPIGAKIISIQNQLDKPCIHAMVDSNAKGEIKTIAIIGTGNQFPKINPDEQMVHIGTVQIHGMIWHVFEIVQNEADDLKGIRFGQDK